MRAFRQADFDIKCNEFTKDYIDSYADTIRMCDKRVFEEGNSKVIICFYNYNMDNYNGFFIVNDEFEPKHIKELKKCIEKLAEELQAKRLDTESMDCKELNHWHDMLGFKLEGTKRKAFNGNDYNIWSILWD